MSDDGEFSLEGRAILVIEDEAYSRDTIVRALENMGAPGVAVAANGIDALTHIQTAPSPPDLLIVDIVMPEMGGVELLRKLAEGGFEGDIVLYSGTEPPTMESLKRVAEFRGLNVLGCIAKPVTRDALKNAIAGN